MVSNKNSNVIGEHDGGESRTDIKSHAIMVVVGKHETLLSDSRNNVDVIPFSPDYHDL